MEELHTKYKTSTDDYIDRMMRGPQWTIEIDEARSPITATPEVDPSRKDRVLLFNMWPNGPEQRYGLTNIRVLNPDVLEIGDTIDLEIGGLRWDRIKILSEADKHAPLFASTINKTLIPGMIYHKIHVICKKEIQIEYTRIPIKEFTDRHNSRPYLTKYYNEIFEDVSSTRCNLELYDATKEIDFYTTKDVSGGYIEIADQYTFPLVKVADNHYRIVFQEGFDSNISTISFYSHYEGHSRRQVFLKCAVIFPENPGVTHVVNTLIKYYTMMDEMIH